MNEPYISRAAQSPVFSAPPASGYYTPPVTPKPTTVSDRRDLLFAGLLLPGALVSVNWALFGGFQLGFALAYILLTVSGLLYMRRCGRVRPYGLFCGLAALAGAGVFLWHDDGFTRFWLFAGILFLTMLATVEYTGEKHHDSGGLAALGDVLELWVGRPLASLSSSLGALFRREQDGRIEKRRFGGIFLGLLCALPVVLVVVPLLCDADAAFEGLLAKTITARLGEWVASAVLGLGLFCLIFSRLFSLRHKTLSRPVTPPREQRRPSTLSLCAFLSAISVVFLVYLFAQLAYFTNAFSGILPAEFTVAQYARRGFFEMCVLCAINLALTGGCLALSRKTDEKAPLAVRLLCLFILLFSLGLVATSAAKMVLYVGSFGMTRLRLLTQICMAMMAVGLLSVLFRLFSPRFPYMRVCVIAVAVIGLAAAYCDVDRIVATYNVRAYETGRLEKMDVDALAELSNSALPALNRLRAAQDEEVRNAANRVLLERLENIAERQENGQWVLYSRPDWRRFSFDRYRAHEMLLDMADELTQWQESRTGVFQYAEI